MKLELHCHSICSDGSFPPEDVARRAGEYGARVFCLTDHDTFAGYGATVSALDGSPTTVLRGMELSCKEGSKTVHLLLYGLREGPGLDALQERVNELIVVRTERLRQICARLETLGVSLDAEKVLRSTHGVPGRPAVAGALVEAGVCSSRREAFDRFLKDGGPADVQIDRITLEHGLALGLGAGGRASIAHPHTFGRYGLAREICKRHRDHGLEGLEAFYGRYGRAQTEGWLRLADELDMVATGGSDFHGEMSPGISRPGIDMPEERAERLLGWLNC